MNSNNTHLCGLRSSALVVAIRVLFVLVAGVASAQPGQPGPITLVKPPRMIIHYPTLYPDLSAPVVGISACAVTQSEAEKSAKAQAAHMCSCIGAACHARIHRVSEDEFACSYRICELRDGTIGFVATCSGFCFVGGSFYDPKATYEGILAGLEAALADGASFADALRRLCPR